MNNIELGEILAQERACFNAVRKQLNTPDTRTEYNLCFKKSWRFYREHSPEEAVAIIKDEISQWRNELHQQDFHLYQ